MRSLIKNTLGHGLGCCALLLFLSAPALAGGDGVTSSLISIDTIKTEAAKQKDAASEFLSKAIQYQSVEDFGYQLKPETEELLKFVFKEAQSMGFSTRLAADGLVGVLEYGEGEETVGVLIHVDVVPADSSGANKWTYPPFSGTVTDTHIWGRGAQDDKGALAATLWGAKILIDNQLNFKRKLRIILGTKEEKSFEGLTKYFQEEKQPDYGIVPDGVFFTWGEKGIADMDFTFTGLTASVATRDEIVHWEGGTVINTVPDFSYLVINSTDPAAALVDIEARIKTVTAELNSGKSNRFFGLSKPYSAELSALSHKDFIAKYPNVNPPSGDLVVFASGVATHSGAPWDGKNAIVELALLGSTLESIGDSAYKRGFDFVASQLGIDLTGAGLLDEKGKGIGFTPPFELPPAPPNLSKMQYYGTSLNLGLANVDSGKDALVLSIDFRTGLGNTNDEIMTHSKVAAAKFGGTVAYQPGIGSHYESVYATTPIFREMIQSYKEFYPDRPKSVPYMFFTSASTYVKLASNFVNFGPVDLYPDPTVFRFHQKNERISIDDLVGNIGLFAHGIQTLIQREESLPK